MGKKRPRPEPEKKEEEMDRPSTSKEPSTSSKQPSAQQQSQSSSTSTKSKPRVWKSLKQVVTAERLQPGAYAALEAAPSLRPWRKYSDLTGLVAPYTDPKTKLRYANKHEYARLRLLSADQVNGYLVLRRAALPVT
ncbi:INO80 complex subunit C [Rhipicephalus microplus]|uniref:Putative ino80 complex subunit c n=1 Tax=Rhipicephalus microplus TaxID=6941 RepID=A0A6M2CSH1_RHIMP|nr:LOW QUALITY PROTEIN: INO80 complex subunit C-like [Rhipicephalus microplus]